MAKKEKKQKKQKSPVRRAIGIVIKIIIALLLTIVVVGGILLYMKYGKRIMAMESDAKKIVAQSSLETFRQNETSIIYDSNGTIISKLKGERDVYYIKYKDIPKDDAIGILSSVGGFEFACIVGVILGAAANHGLVIIDGFNTSACALVAKTLVPQVMDYVMASHLSAEKAAKSSLENLGLEAYVDLGLCLGEASGGSIQMGMLDLAVHMYLALTGGKA